MTRLIKVNVLGWNGFESRLLSLAEAEAVMAEVYSDPLGGIVTDAVTGEVISRITPETREITISEVMGGG